MWSIQTGEAVRGSGGARAPSGSRPSRKTTAPTPFPRARAFCVWKKLKPLGEGRLPHLLLRKAAVSGRGRALPPLTGRVAGGIVKESGKEDERIMEQKQKEAAESCMRLIRTHNNAVHRFFLAEGLHPGQAVVLRMLSEEGTPPTQKEIARELMVSAPTVAACIRRLEESGCIQREPDEEDGRCNRIHLTERGREISAQCTRGFRTVIDTMMEGFSEAESEQLRGFLERMTENIVRLNEEEP